MDRSVTGHGLRGRRQRLAEHLTTEDRAPAEVLALSAKQALFKPLEAEQSSSSVSTLGMADMILGADWAPQK